MSLPVQNDNSPKSRAGIRDWVFFSLRWGIAIAGIWWVLSNLSLHDQVLVASDTNGWPTEARLAVPAGENDSAFQIVAPDGQTRSVPRDQLLARLPPARIRVNERGRQVTYDQLAQKVVPGAERENWPILVTQPRNLWQRFWNVQSHPVRLIEPVEIVGGRPQGVPYPLIEQGLGPMVRNADGRFLLLSVAVFPIVYFITSWRWHALLKALAINIRLSRAFVLNMVGAFYNTFMPGSTGGDLLKAWYIAKQTHLRTRAVMSVIVDRILGLLALVIMGGSAAAFQYARLDGSSSERVWCGRVAVGSLLIVAGISLALLVFYHPVLRRVTGLDFIIRRLPMQTQVNKALEAMELYRRRPGLILWALIVTLPVHGTVVLSATFAGLAFGLPLRPAYYWVVVPVVVLSGAIPISPQGAGVMEFFAILLTRRQGATISQAFALTMSIRLVQILWNLVGGIFVLRGGYHAPSQREQLALESDPDPAAEATLRR
jgi:uncharacterized protein (TIRG00374 family)